MSKRDLSAAEAPTTETAAGAAPTRPAGLDWAQVRLFLIQHPDRIQSDRDLLERLGLTLSGPNVVDFSRAALTRLEAVAAKETVARKAIEQVARANFAAQAQAHAAVITLLEARSQTDLARRLDEAARERFGLSAGVIALEGPGAVPAGWRALEPDGVDRLVGTGAFSRLGLDAADPLVFGPQSGAVRSAALVRMALWSPARHALVGFGSADPDGFSPDMGAELVAFVTRVVERTAERWPVL